VTDRETLLRAFDDWSGSSFRLEALDHYSVEFEREEFEAFLRGDPLPPPTPPEFDAWLDQLRRERAEGRIRSRVHAIAGPLTPYLHYEIDWAYKGNAAAGEDIRIVHSASWETSPFGGAQPPDFYLLDDERVILLAYDDVGQWLGGEIITDLAEVTRYRRLRDIAMTSARPLAEYLATLRRLPVLPLMPTPAPEALSA
jgi:hypothetical protein